MADRQHPNALPFDYNTERLAFNRTFALLRRTLGSNTSQRWVESRGGYGGGFSVSHFEAFAVGVGRVADKLPTDLSDLLEPLKQALEEAKRDPQMRASTTGGGKNYRPLYERKIALVENRVRAVLG